MKNIGLLSVVSLLVLLVPNISTAAVVLYIDDDGKIGIGNSDPQTKVDISGAIQSRLVNKTSSASPTINWDEGNVQSLVLSSATTTPTFSNGHAGGMYKLLVTQDGTGDRSISWPSGVLWPNSTPPTLSTASLATDIFSFVSNGSTYFGSYDLGYDTSAGSIAYDNSAKDGQEGGYPASGSFDIDIGTLDNGIAVIAIATAVGAADPMSVTVGSTTATYYGTYQQSQSGNYEGVQYFYVLHPEPGNQTVAWMQSTSTAQYINAYAATYSGVNQTTPINTYATGDTLGGSLAVTGTTTVNSTWAVITATSLGGGVDAGTGVTALQDGNNMASAMLGDSGSPLLSPGPHPLTITSNVDTILSYALFLNPAL